MTGMAGDPRAAMVEQHYVSMFATVQTPLLRRMPDSDVLLYLSDLPFPLGSGAVLDASNLQLIRGGWQKVTPSTTRYPGFPPLVVHVTDTGSAAQDNHPYHWTFDGGR